MQMKAGSPAPDMEQESLEEEWVAMQLLGLVFASHWAVMFHIDHRTGLYPDLLCHNLDRSY